MKKKNCALKGMIVFFLFGILITSPGLAKEERSTTFPVDKAGIGAYVRLDDIEGIDLRAFANALSSVEELNESYVIGTLKIEVAPYDSGSPQLFTEPHLYIGSDGWIVAYYLRTEESSRIMQWKSYQPGKIETTTLKDAIDYIVQKVGATYSSPVKYYHFAFPEANKMTLVVDHNDFYVAIPGTLYEASYGVFLRERYCGCGCLKLSVDENLVYEGPTGEPYCRCVPMAGCFNIPFTSYGFFNLSNFQPNVTHHIVLKRMMDSYLSPITSVATVFIYKN